jgi:hypothetical protein
MRISDDTQMRLRSGRMIELALMLCCVVSLFRSPMLGNDPADR